MKQLEFAKATQKVLEKAIQSLISSYQTLIDNHDTLTTFLLIEGMELVGLKLLLSEYSSMLNALEENECILSLIILHKSVPIKTSDLEAVSLEPFDDLQHYLDSVKAKFLGNSNDSSILVNTEITPNFDHLDEDEYKLMSNLASKLKPLLFSMNETVRLVEDFALFVDPNCKRILESKVMGKNELNVIFKTKDILKMLKITTLEKSMFEYLELRVKDSILESGRSLGQEVNSNEKDLDLDPEKVT